MTFWSLSSKQNIIILLESYFGTKIKFKFCTESQFYSWKNKMNETGTNITKSKLLKISLVPIETLIRK